MWLIKADEIMYKLIEKLVATNIYDTRYCDGIRYAIELIKKAESVDPKVAHEVIKYESSIEVIE